MVKKTDIIFVLIVYSLVGNKQPNHYIQFSNCYDEGDKGSFGAHSRGRSSKLGKGCQRRLPGSSNI